MQTKSVLITGGAGFIGQRLAQKLLSQGHKVRILDNFNPQIHATENLPNAIQDYAEIIKADVRNSDAVKLALRGIDTVIHLAAETGTGQSMYEIERYFSVNVQGTATLLDLLQNDAAGKTVKSIIVASSRAIYGEGAYECRTHGIVYPEQRSIIQMDAGQFEPLCPICNQEAKACHTDETATFKPMSVYGLTKQVQEQAILLFAKTRRINGFALRYQNVYGPGQSLKNPYTGILAVFSNLARQNQPIEIYEDGEESRDFVYIDDVIEATQRCVNFTGNYIGALNIGSGIATSVLTVAKAIKSHFNSNSPIVVSGAYRQGDIRHNMADTTLSKQTLDFVPQVEFSKGLTTFLNWASNQALEDKNSYQHSVMELKSKGLMGISKHIESKQ
jgi:dTDP-L-rhamnose 4-epimerase